VNPQVIPTVAGLRARLAGERSAGRTIGLVPTMGALHAGHGALIDAARREADVLAVSVFVNPIQFDRAADYEKYARNLPADVAFCGVRGVDVVFAPAVEEMYPEPQKTFVEVAGVSSGLCGAFRPGHFRGVATVVSKLFHVVQPDIAYFGQKDAQQLAVIRRMAADLNMPVRIVGVPTVREPDGLAMSSRNKRLSAEERRAAPVLYRALSAAREKAAAGCRDAGAVREAGLAVLRGEALVRVEYLEVVDAAEMQPVGQIAGPVCIAAAIWLGATRLIDNVNA
jgi:pantoate--beta-alanine ligase